MPECEAWFAAHGLPWFVEDQDARVAAALGRGRIVRLAAVVLPLGVALGVGVGLLAEDVAAGALTATCTMLGAVAVYGLVALGGGVIVRWAAHRTVAELGVMVPLVTRALPLLLLFTTFLFVNTEVWQVASSLERATLWLAVLLFAAVAVAFLLARLPEELTSATRRAGGHAGLRGRQRANLLLVLLVAQALQVLLLAVAVFGYFVVFGTIAIDGDIVESWTGARPTALAWEWIPVSNQLFQVSVFLAGFSGLYFTVYAVQDATYREQFFTRVSGDLEQAVRVHARYREALESPDTPS